MSKNISKEFDLIKAKKLFENYKQKLESYNQSASVDRTPFMVELMEAANNLSDYLLDNCEYIISQIETTANLLDRCEDELKEF